MTRVNISLPLAIAGVAFLAGLVRMAYEMAKGRGTWK